MQEQNLEIDTGVDALSRTEAETVRHRRYGAIPPMDASAKLYGDPERLRPRCAPNALHSIELSCVLTDEKIKNIRRRKTPDDFYPRMTHNM